MDLLDSYQQLFYLHLRRAGDQPGSSPHRERLGERHASASHQLYQLNAMNALHYPLHLKLPCNQHVRGELHQSVNAIEHNYLHVQATVLKYQLNELTALLYQVATRYNESYYLPGYYVMALRYQL